MGNTKWISSSGAKGILTEKDPFAPDALAAADQDVAKFLRSRKTAETMDGYLA